MQSNAIGSLLTWEDPKDQDQPFGAQPARREAKRNPRQPSGGDEIASEGIALPSRANKVADPWARKKSAARDDIEEDFNAFPTRMQHRPDPDQDDHIEFPSRQ